MWRACFVLAERAASEGPRWTRAMEDHSAPIPEEIMSKLGWIIGFLAATGQRTEDRVKEAAV